MLSTLGSDGLCGNERASRDGKLHVKMRSSFRGGEPHRRKYIGLMPRISLGKHQLKLVWTMYAGASGYKGSEMRKLLREQHKAKETTCHGA